MTAKTKKIIDLTKLAPRLATCETSVGDVEISRLSVGDIASVMIKFPEIGALLNESGGRVELSRLATSAPEALPYIIAMGTPGKVRSLDGVKSLSAADQLLLLSAVFEHSFPEGLEGFLSAVEVAFRGINPRN